MKKIVMCGIIIGVVVLFVLGLGIKLRENTMLLKQIQSQLNTIQLQTTYCVPLQHKEKNPNIYDKG